MKWNYGDMLDAVGQTVPTDHPAIHYGDVTLQWGDFHRHTNRLAREFLARGLMAGDKVAFYMRNQPEYMIALVAALKARLVHVNVNYRYRTDELQYIFDNSDTKVVVYDEEFRDRITTLQPQLPGVDLWLEVGSAQENAPFALSFETFAAEQDGTPLKISRSPDDLFFIYTGGTTGLPKAVMWTHDGLVRTVFDTLRELGKAPADMEDHARLAAAETMHAVQLPACPLMHGSGLLTGLMTLVGGGTVVLMDTRKGFDAHALWRAVDRHKVTSIIIVGDAFASPMLRALDEAPGTHDGGSLESIGSSGVIFSTDVKKGLLAHLPQVKLVDSLGSSEAPGCGTSVMTAESEVVTAQFVLSETCKVFSEDGRAIPPGSDEAGLVALCGNIPIGYYKDPEKTARTFREIDGILYSIPGDWCKVAKDGTLTLLGRGSTCINTGGEKVYPEEVEEALKEADGINDAIVVGLPDERWGQAIIAVVAGDDNNLDEGGLKEHVRARLADYKVPKRILFDQTLYRFPNGKADHESAKAFAAHRINQSA